MIPSILLVALGGLLLVVLQMRFLRARMRWRRRNAVEYYLDWGGYTLPIGLQSRITREAAEARHAEGTVRNMNHITRPVRRNASGTALRAPVNPTPNPHKLRYTRQGSTRGRSIAS